MQKKNSVLNENLLETYFKQIKAFPLLSFDEELTLSKQIQEGNQESLQKLINSNLRLVVKIAGLYISSNIPILDLIQEGNIGLIYAAKKYDYRKNVRFCTYASWWIRQFISRYRINGKRLIRLPLRKAASSINQIVEDDSIVNLYEDYTYSPERDFMKQAANDDAMRILSKLKERERRILSYRYQLNGCQYYSLREIGAELDLSPETVRQIERRALKKIRSQESSLRESLFTAAM
ncbi:MAG: sigma-70 family RNA polymerase sigma factor [Treponema sp.]|nr:sigma-70 family RNA polymerase sigma factor [Treponema sp.]